MTSWILREQLLGDHGKESRTVEPLGGVLSDVATTHTKQPKLASRAGFLEKDQPEPQKPVADGSMLMQEQLSQMRQDLVQQKQDAEELNKRLFGTLALELESVKAELEAQRRQTEQAVASSEAEKKQLHAQLEELQLELVQHKSVTKNLEHKFELSQAQLKTVTSEKDAITEELEKCHRELSSSEQRVSDLEKMAATGTTPCQAAQSQTELTKMSNNTVSKPRAAETSLSTNCSKCSDQLMPVQVPISGRWICDICESPIRPHSISMQCSKCDFDVCDQCDSSSHAKPAAVNSVLPGQRHQPVGVVSVARRGSPRRLDFDKVMNLAGESRSRVTRA